MLAGRRRQTEPSQALARAAGALTLPSLLRERGCQELTRDRIALRLIDKATETIASATYGELWRRSAWVARTLEREGVRSGDPVVLLMETRLEFYYALFGAMLVSALPVAVYPPAGPQQLLPALDHLRKVAQRLPARAFVTSQQLYGVATEVRSQAPGLSVITIDRVGEVEPGATFPGESVSREEPVLLQYTSGSLAEPKAIELCTRSIFSNLTEIGDAFEMREGDVGLSWLPLYHDMGLHSVFFDLLFEMPLVLMSPLDFIRRPSAWLRAASRYGVTHSPAPSFGYAYAARRVRDEELEKVDLSRWRVAMCGAEAIDAEALGRFAERFGRFGFSEKAFMGAYGLAENTVAVSFAPASTGLRVERLEPEALATDGVARPSRSSRALSIASVGVPIQGHDVRIVAADGGEAPDGTQGEIQVRGSSRMLGYRGDPDSTQASFDGEWLRTGDLGYARDGELFITGRIKDLIIRGGKNYYPQDLEAAAAKVEGVRPGAIAAFGRRDPAKGTEEIVIVAEVKKPEAASDPSLSERVRQAIFDGTGLGVDRVVLAVPGAVPKTTSGKLRRGETRARYDAGKLQPPTAPGMAVLARVGLFNLLPAAVQRAWDRVARALRARTR